MASYTAAGMRLTPLQVKVRDYLKERGGSHTIYEIWTKAPDLGWKHSRSGVGHACSRLAEMGELQQSAWHGPLAYTYVGGMKKLVSPEPVRDKPAIERLRDKLTGAVADGGQHAAFLVGVLDRRAAVGDVCGYFEAGGESELAAFEGMCRSGLMESQVKGGRTIYMLTHVGTKAGRAVLSKPPAAPAPPARRVLPPVSAPRDEPKVSDDNMPAVTYGNGRWDGGFGELCYERSPATWGVCYCLARKGHNMAHRAYNGSDTDHVGNPVGTGTGWKAEWGGDTPAVWLDASGSMSKQPDNSFVTLDDAGTRCNKRISQSDKRISEQRGYRPGSSTVWKCFAREGHTGNHRAYDYGSKNPWGTVMGGQKGWAAEWGADGHVPDNRFAPGGVNTCRNVSSFGRTCLAEKGHSGNHRAYYTNTEYSEEWENTSSRSRRPDNRWAGDRKPWCGVIAPSGGPVCNAGPGHTGDHVAYSGSGRAMEEWAQ